MTTKKIMSEDEVIGILGIPSEKTAIRIADAMEKMVSITETVDFSILPGNKKLIKGDKHNGLLGFVQSEDFITGSAVATALGITTGSLINDNTPWIKYIRDGKICFYPLLPIRHSVPWDTIYNSGAVYGTGDEGVLPPQGRMGVHISIDASDNSINTTNQRFLGDKTSSTDYADTVAEVGDTLVLKGWSTANNGEVTVVSITDTKIVVSGKTLVSQEGTAMSRFFKKENIVKQDATIDFKGLTAKVRLMRGCAVESFKTYAEAGIGKDNEYNWLIGQLHEHVKLKNWKYPQYMDPDLVDWGVYLSDNDLGMDYTKFTGSYRLMQETYQATSWRRASRGYNGASALSSHHSWNVHTGHGLSVVLEFPQNSTL